MTYEVVRCNRGMKHRCDECPITGYSLLLFMGQTIPDQGYGPVHQAG